MGSIPLTIAPAATATPASPAEGSVPVKGGTASAVADNQQAGQSFVQLMKQVGPKDKKGKAEDLLPVLPDAAPAVPAQPPAAPLPPAGMMLPIALPQPLRQDSLPVDRGGQAKFQGVKDQAVLAAQVEAGAGKQGGDKAVITAADAGDEKHPATQFMDGDMATRLMLPSQATMHGSPDGHQVAQAMIKDMDALLGERRGVEANALRAADGIIANQGAGALLQAGDKSPPPAVNTAISVPLGHPEWNDELSNRISWMVRQEVQSASVRLNPPHLGPLEIKVSLVNDQVNVSFTTHHAPVREALDASLPRLREMLGDSGLQLGDANVTHRSYSDQQQSGQQSNGYSGGDYAGGAAEDGLLAATQEPLHYLSNGAVDLYA